MNRLTPFARIIIVALLLGLLFLGYKKFIAPNESKTEITSGNVGDNSQTENNITEATEASNVSEASDPTPFNFTAPEPVNGQLKGVVELGATGFNSFIVRIDQQKNWKLEKADYGASLVYENMASDNDIKSGLKNYIADMLAYGVNGKNIHFVISSGAKKAEITGKIIATLKSLGFVVNEVTPEQEGKLALKCVLPKSYYNKAFVTDIGSGNTKISWIQNGITNGIEAPGSKYYEKTQESEAIAQVKIQANKVPKSLNTTCFIIGGIPFELAKQVRKDKERYTVLNNPEQYTPKGEKQIAGLNIYKTIKAETGCTQFVFDWDANFTIGFLLGL